MSERNPAMDPVHPGKLLREDVLPGRAMSKTAVTDALIVYRQALYGALNEKQPISAGMVLRLGKLFVNGPTFWVNLQGNYDLARAGRTVDVSGIPALKPERFGGSGAHQAGRP